MAERPLYFDLTEAELLEQADTSVDLSPLSWQVDAVCAQTNPEAFFPEVGDTALDAKRICAICEVTAKCLAYALYHDAQSGIWGGLSEQERRSLQLRGTHSDNLQQYAKDYVEVYEHRAKRTSQLIKLIDGDKWLRRRYYDRPEEMLRTTQALLSTVYGEGGTATADRRERLEAYFLNDKYEELSKKDYRELLQEDLTHVFEQVDTRRVAFEATDPTMTFAQYWLSLWKPAMEASSAQLPRRLQVGKLSVMRELLPDPDAAILEA